MNMKESSMYHTYINNRYTDDQVRQMRSADSPSKTTENFITMDELSFLRKQIEKIQYPEEGKTSKYSGASYNDPIGQVLKKMFDKRIKNLIGDYDLDFFAWQEAIHPQKIHAALRLYPDKIPYKAILIPLDVISNENLWKETYTITFKQRNYLEGNLNSNTGKKGNTDQIEWKRPYDTPGLQNLTEGYNITLEQHKKYFSHIPYEYLEGLEIDNIYKWTPGSCVTWDQNQLHCADNFLQNNIQTKLSLIFFTNQL